jgi:hypothetical protein
MSDTDDVAGTIDIQDADGRYDLPDKYVDDKIVIRDPGTTVEVKIKPPVDWWYYNPEPSQNPELAPDRLSLKLFGEDPDVYRVDGVDQIDRTSDGDK